MWPFRRKPVTRTRKAMRNVVAGLIIGGAIGSILGQQEEEEAAKKSVENKENSPQ